MKLYPIIFTNEAAKTPQESLERNIVAVDLLNTIVLFDTNRFQNKEQFTKDMVRATVAMVSYNEYSPDLYKVDTSAGIEDFGPLAYQITMKKIDPAWLKSDVSLTKDSLVVWQKMYKLSQEGVYKKQWLGYWGWDELIPSCVRAWTNTMHSPATKKYLEKYLEEVRENFRIDEAYFLEHIRKSDLDLTPAMFGNFWCYKKTSHDPLIDEMFQQGNKFIEEVKEKFNIDYDEFTIMVQDAVDQFFTRLYR